MTLLVIQEQHFMRLPNGEVWVDRQSDRRFWERYLAVFDRLVVCARMREVSELGPKALRSDRPEVSFVGMPDFRGTGGIIKHYAAIQKALKEALSQADCVIYRAPSPISMVSYASIVRSGKPFAVELMINPWTHYSPQSMHNVLLPVIRRFITDQTKRMCRRANGVSYVTEHVLQDLYPSTARLKGESRKYFESSYSTIDLSKEAFIKADWPTERPSPVVFVHSGEMVDNRKGQDVFIQCLSILKQRGYDVRGILIGDGDMRPEFEQLARTLGVGDEIEFVGWKSGFKAVQAELMRGHIFIFPSTGEGLPRSVIEAMATGLVCYGSAVDGMVELLDSDQLVETLDGEAFADRIEPALRDWESTLRVREIQFERAHKYENIKLQKRRTDFYGKLRACAENTKERG